MNIKANKLVRMGGLITVICELLNHFKTRLLKGARLRGEITTAALVSQPPGEDIGYVRSTLDV